MVLPVFILKKKSFFLKVGFIWGKDKGKCYSIIQKKKKYSRQFFLDDSWEGKQEFYYKNGQIKTILQYHHSRANGKSTLYYENGKIKRETNFLNGKRDGFDRIYTEEGILIDEGEYKQNKPISIHRRWNERSNLLEKRIFHEAGYFDLFKWDEKNNNIFEGIFQKDGKYKERKKEGEKIIEKNGCWDGKKLIIT
jgi:predicted ATP-dependent endonuclease of OLD family